MLRTYFFLLEQKKRKLSICFENMFFVPKYVCSKKVKYLLRKYDFYSRKLIICFENMILLTKMTKTDGTSEPSTFWGSPVRPRTLGGHGHNICIASYIKILYLLFKYINASSIYLYYV